MKKLLIIVDYQVDFVDGALGFPGASHLAPYLLEAIRAFEKAGDDVVFTKDVHPADYLTTIEGQKLPIPHCLEGTPGAELYGPIKAASAGHFVYPKPTFGSAILFDYLRVHHYAEIVLMGLVSHICVLANAVIAKTASPDSRIVVDSKGTSSFDVATQEKGYDVLRNLHIDVI